MSPQSEKNVETYFFHLADLRAVSYFFNPQKLPLRHQSPHNKDPYPSSSSLFRLFPL